MLVFCLYQILRGGKGQGSLAIQPNSRKHLAARIWMMHYVAQCMLNVGAQGDYTVPTATCLLHLRGGFPPLAHHGPVWSAWFPTASRRVGLHGRILESGWPDASILHAKDTKYASMRGFSAGHDEAVGEYISARLYILYVNTYASKYGMMAYVVADGREHAKAT